MDSAYKHRRPFQIHLVTSSSCSEFTHLLLSLRRSTVIGLDAEWKPRRSTRAVSDQTGAGSTEQSPFPTVTLLQIACRIESGPSDRNSTMEIGDSLVFLVDLLAVPLSELWEPIKEMFASEKMVKLGFRFKQDLVYLSHTFSSQGCSEGFNKVEPFLDITNIYSHLKYGDVGRKSSRQNKSLATICEELLGISLSKELQCSNWSCRPLSEEQVQYAAADAYYLLELFSIFQQNCVIKGKCGPVTTSLTSPIEELKLNIGENDNFLRIISEYGEKIVLNESDKKPKITKKKFKQQNLSFIGNGKEKCVDSEWKEPAPWDLSIGGDGCPKFLCDVMVEGLAKHLRCVGIDAATSASKKPDPRELLNQANKEKRVLLTRDAKLLKYQYLVGNQVYKVKSLLKNEQLLEVINIFQLNISEDKLMTRCTKCNGSFIQKPLTLEEAIEASKGFQVIPNCLFNRNMEFWKCTDCHQLYWEGTQYHNAVQKFISICKLNDEKALNS